jgi:hypothetical protein
MYLSYENDGTSDQGLLIRLYGSYLLTYLAAVVAPKYLPASIGVRVSVGLLALALFGFLVWMEIRSLLRSDELRRRIRIEAFAIAHPLSLLLVMTLFVFQQLLGLSVDWLHVVAISILIPYYVGVALARRRYS